MQDRIVLGAVTLAMILAQIGHSVAAGAIAVGLPSDVVHQGVSLGARINAATMDEAKSDAMKDCKTAKAATAVAQSLCKIVATFQNQCVSIVVDPRPHTPGFGWAVADTSEAAGQQAIANCQDSDGPTLKDGCQPDTQIQCDGSAK
jgi:hypothetical protein